MKKERRKSTAASKTKGALDTLKESRILHELSFTYLLT